MTDSPALAALLSRLAPDDAAKLRADILLCWGNAAREAATLAHWRAVADGEGEDRGMVYVEAEGRVEEDSDGVV